MKSLVINSDGFALFDDWELLTNLIDLEITHHYIYSNDVHNINIEFLRKLPQLKKFKFELFTIHDWSPLSSLVNLEKLILSKTNIKSIKHIAPEQIRKF